MHRLLSRDSRFTATKTWELLCAPTVSQKLFWLGLGRLDDLCGSPIQKLLILAESKLFAKSNAIHKTSLFETEEDEFFLLHTFDSATLYFLFPDRTTLWKYCYFDECIPLERRKKIMAYYRNCLKKHLYVFGREKIYMTKNPSMCSKIRSIYETFPDARVVCLIRTPYQSVPSLINLFHHLFKQANGEGDRTSIQSLGQEVASYFYRYSVNTLAEYPASQRRLVMYDDLIKDPLGTARLTYDALGYTLSDSFLQVLKDEAVRAGKSRRRHNDYSQHGISKASINNDYGWVFEKFGFEMEAE
jgi:hypothetical protein